MKKVISIVACSFVCLVSSFSASAVDFGIKGGMVVSKLPTSSSNIPSELTSNAIGFLAGVTASCRLSSTFTIEPSLQYHLKGTKVSEVLSKDKIGFGYIELPVMLQGGVSLANNNLRLFAQGGPFIGYAVSKTLDIDWADINRFEYGAAAGIGARFWKVQLSVLYNWSFGHLASSTTVQDIMKYFTKKNFSGWTVSLSLFF